MNLFSYLFTRSPNDEKDILKNSRIPNNVPQNVQSRRDGGSGSKSYSKLIPLVNFGNTSFINAALQILFRIEGFPKFCDDAMKRGRKNTIWAIIHHVYSERKKRDHYLRKLVEHCAKHRIIDKGKHGDPSEFLTKVMDSVADTPKEIIWKVTPFKQCLNCESTSHMKMEIETMGVLSSHESLQRYFDKIYFQTGRFGLTKMLDKCCTGEEVSHAMYSVIDDYPKFAIIRVEQEYGQKDGEVTIPRILNVAHKNEKKDDFLMEYLLVGVVMRRYTQKALSRGHYFALVGNNRKTKDQKWIRCDNESILPVRDGILFHNNILRQESHQCVVAMYECLKIHWEGEVLDRLVERKERYWKRRQNQEKNQARKGSTEIPPSNRGRRNPASPSSLRKKVQVKEARKTKEEVKKRSPRKKRKPPQQKPQQPQGEEEEEEEGNSSDTDDDDFQRLSFIESGGVAGLEEVSSSYDGDSDIEFIDGTRYRVVAETNEPQKRKQRTPPPKKKVSPNQNQQRRGGINRFIQAVRGVGSIFGWKEGGDQQGGGGGRGGGNRGRAQGRGQGRTGGKKAPKPGTGYLRLQNLGNTCFMNSVLQILYRIDEFPKFLNKEMGNSGRQSQKNIILGYLHHIYFLDEQDRYMYLRAFHDHCVREGIVEYGEQGDPSHFLSNLLNGVASTPKFLTWEISTYNKCLRCKGINSMMENIQNESLVVPSTYRDLNTFFEQNFTQGRFGVTDMMDICEDDCTDDEVPHQMYNSIDVYPEYAIIRIDRGKRVNDDFDVPRILTVPQLISKKKVHVWKYELIGASLKRGYTHKSGHYFAVIAPKKDKQKNWVLCDDSNVSAIQYHPFEGAENREILSKHIGVGSGVGMGRPQCVVAVYKYVTRITRGREVERFKSMRKKYVEKIQKESKVEKPKKKQTLEVEDEGEETSEDEFATPAPDNQPVENASSRYGFTSVEVEVEEGFSVEVFNEHDDSIQTQRKKKREKLKRQQQQQQQGRGKSSDKKKDRQKSDKNKQKSGDRKKRENKKSNEKKRENKKSNEKKRENKKSNEKKRENKKINESKKGDGKGKDKKAKGDGKKKNKINMMEQ